MYTDQNGLENEMTLEDFKEFKNKYPDIAKMLVNPDEQMS